MKQRWLVVIVGLPALLAVLLACPAWATMLVVCGIAGAAMSLSSLCVVSNALRLRTKKL